MVLCTTHAFATSRRYRRPAAALPLALTLTPDLNLNLPKFSQLFCDP